MDFIKLGLLKNIIDSSILLITFKMNYFIAGAILSD